MNIKRITVILCIFITLMCCISAISATSDDVIMENSFLDSNDELAIDVESDFLPNAETELENSPTILF